MKIRFEKMNLIAGVFLFSFPILAHAGDGWDAMKVKYLGSDADQLKLNHFLDQLQDKKLSHELNVRIKFLTSQLKDLDQSRKEASQKLDELQTMISSVQTGNDPLQIFLQNGGALVSEVDTTPASSAVCNELKEEARSFSSFQSKQRVTTRFDSARAQLVLIATLLKSDATSLWNLQSDLQNRVNGVNGSIAAIESKQSIYKDLGDSVGSLQGDANETGDLQSDLDDEKGIQMLLYNKLQAANNAVGLLDSQKAKFLSNYKGGNLVAQAYTVAASCTAQADAREKAGETLEPVRTLAASGGSVKKAN